MKRECLRVISIALLLIPATSPYATNPVSCDSGNPANWLSIQQMTERLSADGWVITRVVKAHGCWKISGKKPEGNAATTYFHPLTGQEVSPR